MEKILEKQEYLKTRCLKVIEHLDKKHRRALFLEVSKHNAQSWFTSTSKDAFSEYPSFIDKINLQEIKENFDGNYHYRYGDI